MPKLSEHKASRLVKMMMIGDSGTGKTGALISLLEAGYRLKILDFDNGLDILSQMLFSEGKSELAQNVEYITLTDKWKAVGAHMIPSGQPKAWSNALKILSTGKLGEESWGDPSEWNEKDILVIDSLTKAGVAAMLNVLQVNGRLMETPYQSDYLEGQRILQGLIDSICSEEYKCNVIVNTHINYIELKEGLVKGFPSTIGKKLSVTMPQSFNIILQAYTKGLGKNATRHISGLPQGMVEVKAAMDPKKLPEQWSIKDGLAKYFELFLKHLEKSS